MCTILFLLFLRRYGSKRVTITRNSIDGEEFLFNQEIIVNRNTLIFFTFAALAFVLAACSTTSDPDSGVDSSRESEVDKGEELTDGSTPQSTKVLVNPTALHEPTAIPEPTVETNESLKGIGDSVSETLLGFTEYHSEDFDIDLVYPEDWHISEDPDLGMVIESFEGIFDSMPRAEGAALIIIPKNELAREEIVEALRQSIFDFGPMPAVYIERPAVTVIGEQVFATAPFREDETGLEGYYAFVQSDDEGAFIFAVTAQIARSTFLSLVETTMNSIILGDEGGNT